MGCSSSSGEGARADRTWTEWLGGPALAVLGGCSGPQSALDAAGRDAERVAELWWWMLGGAAVVWAIVLGAAVYAVRGGPHGERRVRWLVIGGGTVLPTVVLTVLLAHGLSLMPAMLDDGPEGGVRITVTGEQWWWRVRYETLDGRSFELANELVLPVGRRTRLHVRSADVIHALWVPSLGGKIDMIPGRTNVHALEPTRTGVFRGVCAEYCGLSHARMAFYAVVVDDAAYDAWLDAQAAPAHTPDEPLARRGAALFLESGCGACHTVRGTEADGALGPDLTHVGGRRSIGAAVLDGGAASLRRWIAHPAALKPGARMPPYWMLPDDDLAALAAYLEGLR